jgi:flagellar biosynthesis/type III secretory pathway ATPase
VHGEPQMRCLYTSNRCDVSNANANDAPVRSSDTTASNTSVAVDSRDDGNDILVLMTSFARHVIVLMAV